MIDDLPIERIQAFEADLYTWIENAHPSILKEIREKRELSDDLKKTMTAALKEFKDRFVAEKGKK